MLGDHSYPLYIGISILKQLKSTLLSSGFNECILLFSDLPDIVMENCVIESQKMYESTPKSISHRLHVIREQELGPFVSKWYIVIALLWSKVFVFPFQDITPDVTLADLQKEMSPRISANDLHNMLRNDPNAMLCLDIRSISDFNRVHLPDSINIPFNGINLEDKSLESLNEPQLAEKMHNRIIICISNIHENAVEVCVSNICVCIYIYLYRIMFCLFFSSFRNFLWNVEYHVFVCYIKDSIFYIL